MMLAGMSSCNFLDIDPYITDLTTMDTIFTKRDYVQRYLNNLYSYMPDYGAFDAGNTTDYNPAFNFITDEGFTTYKVSRHPGNFFANNEIVSDNIYKFNRWDYFYSAIRYTNTFLREVHKCQEVSDLKRMEWTGEALFLKAMFYMELMAIWGPVPIVPDVPVEFDTPIEDLFVERNTWDECSSYTSGLLKEAIRLLPEQYADVGEVGKATRNAARAALSRLTLYTASPLFNGENAEFAGFRNNAGVPYLNPEKSMEKWAVAAAAAKELVDLKPNDLYTVPKMANTPRFPVPDEEQADFPNGVGGIDPFHSYSDMFNGVCQLASENREILLSRQSTGLNASIIYAAPRVIGGWGSACIPQNQVDAYYMADGRTIRDAGSEYPYEAGFTTNDTTFSGQHGMDGYTIPGGTCRWYVNREMRFYATVAFNNSYYPSTSTPPNMIDVKDGKVARFYSDSKSGKDDAGSRTGYAEPEDYPMTGYLCRKYINNEDSWLSGGRQSIKYYVVFRMAEVYLNYVEAMNELDGAYTVDGVTVLRDAAEMRRCFNLIRHRAGLPGITAADVADAAKMRELILRERQLEMAWESRRYFDLRRTKKAVVYENAPMTGCDVDAKESEKERFHTVVRVTQRSWSYKVFTTRQTFVPIPKVEVDKNPNLDQLPGY
jgi:hypothetical protein